MVDDDRAQAAALTSDKFYKADPTWSPDGKSLAYSTDSDGSMAIFIRNMQTGATRKLTAPFTGAGGAAGVVA